MQLCAIDRAVSSPTEAHDARVNGEPGFGLKCVLPLSPTDTSPRMLQRPA